uniref:Uncharacterized protein n=1 Tax=Tetradesmus obliquus TaxID=3088 RepID=A0A383WKS1_TETOB
MHLDSPAASSRRQQHTSQLGRCPASQALAAAAAAAAATLQHTLPARQPTSWAARRSATKPLLLLLLLLLLQHCNTPCQPASQLGRCPASQALAAAAAAAAAAGGGGGDGGGGGGCLADLLQLRDLDLQHCGGSGSSSSVSNSGPSGSRNPCASTLVSSGVMSDAAGTGVDDSSSSGACSQGSAAAAAAAAAAAELALPPSLTRLRWVRCCARQLPLQQLAAGLPQLRLLLLDGQAAGQAGRVLLQQLSDRGCKVVVEDESD